MSLLELSSINASYDKVQVLFDVSIRVPENGFISLLGKNGVGKTTTLKTILGLTTINSGTISYKGEDITGYPPEQISQSGIAIVPERRRLYSGMTVIDNLRLGHFPHKSEQSEEELLQEVWDAFPKLSDRRSQMVDSMSGGEQQMVAFGRAMMSEPDLFLVDEPTEGLMPTYVDTISEILTQFHDDGKSIILVGQSIDLSLELSEYCYVMDNGRVTFDSESDKLRQNRELRQQYVSV